MLEALVSLRRTKGTGAIGGDLKPGKAVGDILVVKKSPAVWGEMEKRYMLITYLDDPALEASIGDMGVITLPFARTKAHEQYVERCTRRIDISKFTGTEGLDADITVSEPTCPKDGDSVAAKDLIVVAPEPGDVDGTVVR